MYTSRLFDFDKETKTISQEMSTLQANGCQGWDRLYDDACDIGIKLESSKTGKVADFYLTNVMRDGDGDLIMWTLLPTPETIRKNPGLKGWKIKIFND